MHADLSASTLWLMVGLGAFHGVNPAMGWLFAVALGLQERRGRAVARALLPIALGHLIAVGGVVLVTTAIGVAVPHEVLRAAVAAILIGLGGYGLFRHLHPTWVRMRVGFVDLVAWSALVATVHGAGLMVVPALMADSGVEATPAHVDHVHMHAHAAMMTGTAATSASASPLAGVLATGAHTAGYLVVTGLIAWMVYRYVGVGFLRRAWFNIDVAWAVALVLTGALTLVL
jgi:hypothetical protein